MNKRNALEVGIKLIGFYLLVQLLMTVTTLSWLSFQDDFPKKMWPSFVISGACYLVASLVCLLQGGAIAKNLSKDCADEPAATPASALGQLSFWLRLLGLYLGATAVVGLVSLIVHDLAVNHTLTLRTPHLTDNLVQLALSLALVFKNNTIAAFIERRDKKPPSSCTPPGC